VVPDVTLDLLESRVVTALSQVLTFGGRIVRVVVTIERDNLVRVGEQPLAEVRVDESRTARDQSCHADSSVALPPTGARPTE
jgi:hypothetical protein